MAAPPAPGSFVQLGGHYAGNSPAAAMIKEMRTHFDAQTRFTFEGLLGRGTFGMTFRVLERLGRNARRRLAIKRAGSSRMYMELRTEISYLRRVRGAEHIVRMIADRDDVTTFVGTRRLRRLLMRGIIGQTSASLIGLSGPVLVMEYLENSDLARLHYRLNKYKADVPNRILWAFFLCLIRACVGLAYPIGSGPNDPTRLETIPPGVRPAMIEHGDMHLGNGGMGEPFSEHARTPVLKFIDFGMAKERAISLGENLRKATMVLVTLITRKAIWQGQNRVIYKGFETTASEILPAPIGNGARYPNLDVELREFLARCLAWQPKDRLSLDVMLRTAEDGALKPAASYAPNYQRETDAFVAAVLKRLIFDGETDMNDAVFDEVVQRDVNQANMAIQTDNNGGGPSSVGPASGNLTSPISPATPSI